MQSPLLTSQSLTVPSGLPLTIAGILSIAFSLLGLLAHLLLGRHRRIALENLTRALGDEIAILDAGCIVTLGAPNALNPLRRLLSGQPPSLKWELKLAPSQATCSPWSIISLIAWR